MANIPTKELEDLRSSVSQLNDSLTGLIDATNASAAASKNAADADNQEATASRNNANGVSGALGRLFNSTVTTANAVYGLAKTFASIAEAGRQFAEKTGATATRGAQFQLDMNKILMQDIRKFGADQQVIAEQIRGAASSFADVFVGAANGMQISARGSAEFARSLSTGFKSEFTLTAQSMRALVTVGASTTKEFDAFRRASGRAGLSSGQFANLVNKNTLSFMLYGPSFARAAVNAERLGISLESVQRAQESMVTNLDGTIDTIAQLNQLGAGIDFGQLVTLAETQGPEATLKYLQSTIPPNLFQSASTRALISKLGIPLTDLMKQQGSVQASAADKIEQAFTEVAQPASGAARSLADLNKNLKAWDENKIMEIMNGLVGVTKRLVDTITALGAFIISLYTATAATMTKGLGALGLGGGAAAAAASGGISAVPYDPYSYGAVNLAGSTSPPTRAGFFSRTKDFFSRDLATARANMAARGARLRALPSATLEAIKGSPSAVTAAVKAAPGAYVGGIKNVISKAGASGVGTGALAGVFGAMEGYQASMNAQIEEKAKELRLASAKRGTVMSKEDARAAAERSVRLTGREQAMGAGAVQGTTATAGAIAGGAIGTALLTPLLGPLAPIVGGAFGAFIGNIFGKTLNEKFPELAKSIGATFTQIKEALTPVLEKLGELWQTFKGPLFFALKIISAVVLGPLFLGFKLLGFVFSKVIGPVLGFIIDGLKVLGVGWIALINLMIDAINTLLPERYEFEQLELPTWAISGMEANSTVKPATPTTTAEDMVSAPGYGQRTLVTPNGTVALNNRDTVVAYADDMVSGIKTYSLGTLSREMAGSGGGELSRKVDELVSALREANTTIQIDNSVKQVPRMAISKVGAYTRNERT